MCLFCGLQADAKSKKKFSIVQSEETKKHILDKLKDAPNNELNERISARLKDVNSLIKVNARYHAECLSEFYRNRQSTVVGRHLDDDISDVSAMVINFILENDHESQFSLKEILNIDSFEGIPNISAIKRRLINHFKDDVIFFQRKMIYLFVSAMLKIRLLQMLGTTIDVKMKKKSA